MKKADLRLLEAALLKDAAAPGAFPADQPNVFPGMFPGAFDTAFMRLMESEPDDYLRTKYYAKDNGLVHYAAPQYRLFPGTAVDDDTPESEVDTAFATMLSMAGVEHPRITELLGPPQPHEDMSDEPDMQLLALLFVTSNRRRVAGRAEGISQFPDKATAAIRDRMQALLLENPILMHPQFVWDYYHEQDDHRPAVMKPFLHTFMVKGWLPLPVMAESVPELERRRWARHPAVTAALRAPVLELVDCQPSSYAGSVPYAMEGLVRVNNLAINESMLRLDRFRRESFEGAPGLASELEHDRAGEGFLEQLLFHFQATWTADHAPLDRSGELIMNASYRTFFSEVANAPAGVRAKLLCSIAGEGSTGTHVGHVVKSSMSPFAVSKPVNPAARLHHLIRGLVEAGLCTSTPAAARAVATELFTPASDTHTNAPGLVACSDAAQATLRVFKHYGLTTEFLRELMDVSFPVEAAELQSWVDACTSLAAEESMTAILAKAQHDAGLDSGKRVDTGPRRTAL